ncbi:hydrolase [Saccharothrix xinjiangensis]|uniref:hydrolase n=1 Tax=Saccharothrix xinjiangensis TaxID=204798 RepID=UPI0031D6B46A
MTGLGTAAGTSLAAAATGVAELAADHAPAADRARRLRAEVVAALAGAGFAGHFASPPGGPARGTFTELLRALVTVGEACASASWCGLIFATSARMAGFLPAAGRAELWRDGPDVPIATGLTPAGRAERVGDRWRVDGEWRFVSAVEFAEWALVRAPVGSGSDSCFFAVPRRRWTVRDTWFTVGMRGTGSNSLRLDGVTVPDHLVFPAEAVFRGSDDPGAPAFLRPPLLGGHPPLFAATALGAARGGLRSWTAKRPAGASAAPALARSSGELDAAGMLLERAAAAADSGDGPAARTARDSFVAAELVLGAVERLFRAAGTRAQAAPDPLERAWRDVHAATSHAALGAERNSEHYARHVWPADQ